MSAENRRRKAEHIRHILDTEGDSVQQNTRVFNEGRYESTGDLDDYERLKDEARAIKEDAIERLPELIDEVTEAVEANGGTVYLADDAADANRYITEVVDGRTAVKSKSMTSEEIEVNEALEADGADVWETDLAEFVLQIADEAPSHIVAPAIHKSREEIAALFDEVFEPEDPPETAEELTRFAREHLGEKIRDADVGMTGANFVTADTGTLALVTSEGNARKCVQATDTHVAVAGVEKVIPSVEDLQPFVELIGRSGTGQDITSYVSLLTPPTDSPTFGDKALGSGDERDFHLVLIDNGRMEMRDDDQLRETLYCIRCSACANSCANFQHVGGHAFGGETYSGGIATGWEAGVHGEESAAEFNDLCTGCSRCVNQCPVKIDIPWINTVVRDRINRGTDSDLDFLVEGLTPDADPGGIDLQKRLFGNFDTLAKLGSAFAPLSNWVAEAGPARSVLERTLGVDSRRELPRFERESLVDWFADRGSRVDPDAARERVTLYPDAYTNYVRTERGKAAVRVLESLGVHVDVPAAGESGRAPLSQGMVATARSNAEAVYESLAPAVAAGRDVVVIEPSDLAMFHREYGRLLPTEEHEALKERSYEVMEYVYGLLENGADLGALPDGDGERIAYHSHCQQRTLDLEPYTTAVLDDAGFDVVTSDVECCGMAGSFGYKSEYYDLSVDVGETLADQFTTDETADRTVVASGTSCLEQLDALLTRRPAHPVRLLDARRDRR
ncbi:LUD domain-containing protein [Halorubrum ezzemoulense]|uniref:LUD domain-containing protein n=1 Tax=Halorubrum ezzemoulense TaxID=337243 RepID=A0ABT4Z4G1_HALEZ|nr:LUD domain-containing protein [Halorubrum ezzemoulense]MDB2241292.1 LUD domain-containing protein [Halorubrum ezzemoulense]MDB2244995.1 LUD domain-containing protein [Halorubrum ezzemoulense]MDB2251202.1 LUD domain-containing protein [Halorubrum ezzemoulense]MDB2278248.1 LUD domain-containing protein [Halorubrum ezzemoulense]MDB2284922.1 LUD domain-containing protein [Halorubrum ezzemoulense]